MTATQIKRKVPRRWAVLVALAAVMLVGGTALAVHDDPGGPMELEGDIADGAAGGTDWGAIFGADGKEIAANLPAGALDTTDVIMDFDIGATGPDESYHEPSNKDDQAIHPAGTGVWSCVEVNNPTDKTDIVNAYGMAVQGDADAADGDTADDQLFYFGVERFDNSGDAFIGLWLFQDDVTCDPDIDGGKFQGSKQTGDILILANFTGGGSTATIQLFRYTQAVAADDPGTFDDLVTVTGKCENTAEGAGLINDICATLNDTADVVTPWVMEDKTKPGPPNPDVAMTLEPDQFVEGGVNLTDVFAQAELGAPPCFGSFMAETRSSSSLDATLKDYALGDLQFCDARVKIEETATNRVGTEHTFVVDVEQQLGAGYVAAPAGNVDVTLTGADGIEAADIQIVAAKSTCDDFQPDDDNLDDDGRCTLTVNSTQTGTITANARVAVDVGGTALIRDTDPSTATVSGYAAADDPGPAVKTYVDATIDIEGDDTNRVNDEHTFTVTVKADYGDGEGFVAVAGKVVDVDLADTGATSVVDNVPDTVSTCDDGTNASGVCVVKFTSSTTGTTVGTASADMSFDGGNLEFTIDTESDAATTGNESVTKTWVDATIDIEGDDTNRVNDPHTFTVTVMADAGDGNGMVAVQGQVVTVTLDDEHAADAVVDDDPEATSTCDDGTGADGKCIVVFTSAGTGVTTGTASADVTVGGLEFTITTANDATSAAKEDATKTWVNARISISGDDTNSIQEPHTFTVLVEKDLGDGAGFVVAPDEDVDVTLANSNGAVYALNAASTSCDVGGAPNTDADTDPSGECDVVFTSNTAGTVNGEASSSLNVGGVSITVSTDDVGSTGDAVKVFVDGSVKWLKHDGDGQLLGGAEFQLCRTHRLDSSDGSYDVDTGTVAERCVTFVDNAAPDVDPTGGELEVIDLVLGRYTVEETNPPAGYHIKTPPGAGPFTFPDMYINPTPSRLDVELGTIFVNIKAYRVIVITCDDITNTLVDGTVEFDPGGDFADTQETIDADGLTGLGWYDINGFPITEADFCGQVGASFGNLPDDTYDLTVEVPDVAPLFPL